MEKDESIASGPYHPTGSGEIDRDGISSNDLASFFLWLLRETVCNTRAVSWTDARHLQLSRFCSTGLFV